VYQIILAELSELVTQVARQLMPRLKTESRVSRPTKNVDGSTASATASPHLFSTSPDQLSYYYSWKNERVYHVFTTILLRLPLMRRTLLVVSASASSGGGGGAQRPPLPRPRVVD
jgi:hypothetical protein